MALPLLVTLSVPVSILNESLALPVFIGTALLFLRLLATSTSDRSVVLGRQPGQDDARPRLAVLWQVAVAPRSSSRS